MNCATDHDLDGWARAGDSVVAYRTFRDERGREWKVWDVYPTAEVVVRAEFRAGWLAFETYGEKRRLAPIPDGWQSASEAELRAHLARAKSGRPRTLAD